MGGAKREPCHTCERAENGTIGTSHEKCCPPLKGPHNPGVFVTL